MMNTPYLVTKLSVKKKDIFMRYAGADLVHSFYRTERAGFTPFVLQVLLDM